MTPRAVEIPSSGIAAPVISKPDPDGPWVLVSKYYYRDDRGRYLLSIPAGFRFDLASVPRPVWSLIAPFELSIAAPLLHDFIYQHGGRLPLGSVIPTRLYTRAQADRLFRDVMRDEGVAWWRWTLAYAAVRVGGAGSWRA